MDIGEKEIYKLDIFTKNGIEKKTIWDYYNEVTKKLFRFSSQDWINSVI